VTTTNISIDNYFVDCNHLIQEKFFNILHLFSRGIGLFSMLMEKYNRINLVINILKCWISFYTIQFEGEEK
jgi:hypothetical protein